MPNWSRFVPTDFEYDFESDKLSQHEVTYEEAVECFLAKEFTIRRNKKFRDRYQWIARDRSGRLLKIIFQLKRRNVIRIITGWPL